MKIIKNELVGKYAVPEDHPITCANPAPWLIIEVRIEMDYSKFNSSPKMYIRGEGSMWFRADHCYISDKDDCQEYLDIRQHEDKLKSLYFTFTT